MGTAVGSMHSYLQNGFEPYSPILLLAPLGLIFVMWLGRKI